MPVIETFNTTATPAGYGHDNKEIIVAQAQSLATDRETVARMRDPGTQAVMVADKEDVTGILKSFTSFRDNIADTRQKETLRVAFRNYASFHRNFPRKAARFVTWHTKPPAARKLSFLEGLQFLWRRARDRTWRNEVRESMRLLQVDIERTMVRMEPVMNKRRGLTVTLNRFAPAADRSSDFKEPTDFHSDLQFLSTMTVVRSLHEKGLVMAFRDHTEWKYHHPFHRQVIVRQAGTIGQGFCVFKQPTGIHGSPETADTRWSYIVDFGHNLKLN